MPFLSADHRQYAFRAAKRAPVVAWVEAYAVQLPPTDRYVRRDHARHQQRIQNRVLLARSPEVRRPAVALSRSERANQMLTATIQRPI